MVNQYRKHRLPVLVAGGLFLLVLVVVLSRCTQIRNLISPTPHAPQDLSTPELIDQALARGEITDGERLLYLAYAVYEPESLPSQFYGTVPWEGTFLIGEIKEAALSPSKMCILSSYIQDELRRLLGGGATCN